MQDNEVGTIIESLSKVEFKYLISWCQNDFIRDKLFHMHDLITKNESESLLICLRSTEKALPVLTPGFFNETHQKQKPIAPAVPNEDVE